MSIYRREKLIIIIIIIIIIIYIRKKKHKINIYSDNKLLPITTTNNK